MTESPWRVACFDLDGTLVQGTTVSQHLADAFGHSAILAELERRYSAQEISNAEVADIQAGFLRGRRPEELAEALVSIPRIAGIEETLEWLSVRGIDPILCTITWKLAARCFQRWYGFKDVSGTELEIEKNRLTGRVTRHFDKYDKRAFVESYCAAAAIPLSRCLAVGDSHSDIPMFQAVGFSIALNASTEAQAAATLKLNGESLIAITQVIPNFSSAATAEGTADGR